MKADGIIMGSPTYYGQMSAKLKTSSMNLLKSMENLKGK
ncbi:MAG: NAD(P)H-dependent oxidoreductase [Fervidobacterium sp.]